VNNGLGDIAGHRGQVARIGGRARALPCTHWPAYMAANHKQALASYQFQGVLPQLAKEAMHAAISMTNGCDF
jgi:hypothetical protein